ncbi:hypothetical protein C4D60_Mb09t06520 [Musa balbisiana]|uniref:BHLH domain-containing protein n=1 Tax=Musa balbisiana TaxID=52838 RepID=A0A4S8IF97_MUSBA|nr:hypothetical protein C4D60_Mb09t06520 [Musa balbisiana]
MEKEGFFAVNWQPKMYSGSDGDRLPHSFLSLSWGQPMCHCRDTHMESALSSLVSSPSSSTPAGNESVVISELSGRLCSICNSGEISPPSRYQSANNTSCYRTPLDSPPKLILSTMGHQQQGRAPLPMPGNQTAAEKFAPFTADSGFAERAATLSCFGATSDGGLGAQFGLAEAGKLSRVSSSQSLMAASRQQMGASNSGKEAPMTDAERSKTETRLKLGGRTSGSSTPDESSSMSNRMTTSSAETNSRKRKSASKGKAKGTPLTSSNTNPLKLSEVGDSDTKRCRPAETNATAVEPKKQNSAKPSEPPKDYIHVRARRGQATASHSLAERVSNRTLLSTVISLLVASSLTPSSSSIYQVRREKISERMKLLQDLVPGCSKVTGKAVMLDETINYVQALQRQVEFLSMKLATLNPQLDFSCAQQPLGIPLESMVANGPDVHGSLFG